MFGAAKAYLLWMASIAKTHRKKKERKKREARLRGKREGGGGKDCYMGE